jgi:spore coat protein U-like protein
MKRWLRWPIALMPFALIAPIAAGQLSCTVSAPTMNLGVYTGTLLTPGATPMSVTCLILTAYTVALNAGVGVGATTTTREMTGPGSATLSYRMFQNSSRTTNWGNTVGIDTVAGTGTSSAQTLQIYPQVAAGQTIAPGTYTDTITISVNGLLGTVTTTFTVTATVPATCTISASALSFGSYTGALINAASALTVTCTNLATFNIGLNAGTATGATVTTRMMTSPASATLNYVLFRDSARTQNWGNTVGTDTLVSQGTGAAVMYGVYGQMAAGQFGTPAIYTDTIIATITY